MFKNGNHLVLTFAINDFEKSVQVFTLCET